MSYADGAHHGCYPSGEDRFRPNLGELARRHVAERTLVERVADELRGQRLTIVEAGVLRGLIDDATDDGAPYDVR